MTRTKRALRRILPWGISFAALVYVFGYRTDWERLMAATRHADLTLFIAVSALDKLVFFFVWAALQAEAIRRFVTPVSGRAILAIRGGSELFRAVSNPLADGAFLLGVARLTKGSLEAVVAVALIPFVTHLMILLAQITLAIPFLAGGFEQNRDVILTAAVGWTVVGAAAIGLRVAPASRIPGVARAVGWLERIPVRELGPFFACFAILAAFDVVIQGLATRAFGVPIDWVALMARIPILYLALSIPSVGNFGVREFTWSALFADYASSDALVAYAFATNTVFLSINVGIGIWFLRRALDLLSEVQRTRRAGTEVPEPLLRDAADP